MIYRLTLICLLTITVSAASIEQEAYYLSQQVRCVVCQGQSIAESHAPIAVDMRQYIYEQLKIGVDHHRIIDSLAQRYGDFVRMKPIVSRQTALLWILPYVMILIGVGYWSWRAYEPNER